MEKIKITSSNYFSPADLKRMAFLIVAKHLKFNFKLGVMVHTSTHVCQGEAAKSRI